MIDRFGRIALTLAGLLAMSGAAQAADLPAYKQPAKETNLTYDQAITCQATYVVLGAQLEEGSDDQAAYIAFYDAWYDYSAELFPVDFSVHHDPDVEAEADRLFDGWNLLGDAELQAAVDAQLDACEAFEAAELIL